MQIQFQSLIRVQTRYMQVYHHEGNTANSSHREMFENYANKTLSDIVVPVSMQDGTNSSKYVPWNVQLDSVQIDSSFRCKSIYIFSCVFGAMVSFIEFAFAFSVINFLNKKRIKVKLNWSKTWSLFFEKISRVAHIQLQWFENGNYW